MSHLKILFAIESLESGGAQRQMVTLAFSLTQRGHCVEFFVYAPQLDHFRSIVDSAGIRVHDHAKPSRFSLSPIYAIKRILKAGSYDAALAFLRTPSFYCELANSWPKRVALVVSERCSLRSRTFRNRILLNSHRLANHIAVNSHQQRESLIRNYPWMKSKISVIYNGVDLELFTPGIRQCGRTPRLLAIGRVIERKNPIAVINALTHFRERHGHHPSVTWVGEIQDRRYYERCRRLLQDCDLMDSWRWLGERHDVQQLYKQHDALIHPSLLEGVPNAVCEAMASGLPVLVGRIGDHERFVSDYENGFLFDPTSVQSILSALEKFCTSSAKQCFLMGSRSRLLAKKVFCPDRFVDAYETLFQRLIVKSFGGCTGPGSST